MRRLTTLLLAIGITLSAVGVSWALPIPAVNSTTQGNWIGVYGAYGFILNGFDGGDRVSLPSFISSYTTTGYSRWTWASPTSDTRAIEDPANPSTRRATCSFDNNLVSIELDFNKPMAFQLEVYILDWDQQSRSEQIGVTGYTSVSDNSFTGGRWYRYDLFGSPSNPIILTFTHLSGPNAVVSALMFDTPEPTTCVLLAAGLLALARRRRPEPGIRARSSALTLPLIFRPIRYASSRFGR